MLRTSLGYLLTGLSFSVLFASASIAGKFGLQSVDGLTFFTMRFFAAGLFMLGYAHLIRYDRLPAGKEWLTIFIFGTLTTGLYLGLFVTALKSVAAGITALAVGLNPLFISVFTSLWMKRRVKSREWISIGIGITGVAVATYPLLYTAYASFEGLILLLLAMFSYSIGSVYYSSVTWNLSRIAINGWQTLAGGVLLLPFAWLFHKDNNDFTVTFWLSLAWIVIFVSIFAVQLWLRLLHQDAVRASLWLFLCPIFGIGFATALLHEPFVIHTAIGLIIVLLSLYIGQQRSK